MEDNRENTDVRQGSSAISGESPDAAAPAAVQNQTAPVQDTAIPAPATPVATQKSTSGLAVAGLVLGILAILGAFVPLLNILTMPFAIVGLILAIVGLLGINKGKHGGKGIAVAGIVLGAVALVVTIGMYGCAGAVANSSQSSSSAAEESSSQAASSASQEASAGVNANLVGTWDVVGIKASNGSIDADAIDALRANGADYFLNLNEDGTFVLVMETSSDAVKGTWKADGEDSFDLVANGTSITVPIRDGKATMNASGSTIEFEKIETVKDPAKVAESKGAASSSAAAEEKEAADSGEVSADVKEALDSYEAVMDEYVDFMQRYKDSGYSASMLSDYTDMLQKYNDFSEKINAMDTGNMSNADYAYYIEVTSRVSQKLLAAM